MPERVIEVDLVLIGTDEIRWSVLSLQHLLEGKIGSIYFLIESGQLSNTRPFAQQALIDRVESMLNLNGPQAHLKSAGS